MIRFLQSFRQLFLYALMMALLVFLLKWLEWRLIIIDNALDIYIGVIAVFFTALGVWIATQLLNPKVEKLVVEKKIYVPVPTKEDAHFNAAELKKLNLSTREFEVLQLLAKGYSNAEIAQHLFLSLSTVKTHVSNLFVKMNVKRRYQAIEMAKRLNITT